MPAITGSLRNRTITPPMGSKVFLPYVKEYHRTYAAARMMRTLKNIVSKWTGPVYNGEAERLLYDNILSIARQINLETLQPGDVIRKSYVHAIDWAFITEFVSLTQPKYLAQELTLEAIRKQPLYVALNEKIQGKIVLTLGGPATAEKDLRELEKLLTAESVATLSLMYQLTDPERLGVGDTDNLKGKWESLQAHTNKGKGATRDQYQRQEILETRTEIVAAILKCFGPAQKSSESAFYADGLALTNLFLTYLKSIEDYDSGWPKQPYQAVPAAWIMSLSSQASNLSGIWMKAATTPAYYDFYASVKVFKETLTLFDPLVNQFSDWKEMIGMFETLTAKTIDDVPPSYKNFIDKAYANQKTYGQADFLVPELPDPINVFYAAMDKVSEQFSKISAQESTAFIDDEWIKDGYPILSATNIENLTEWTEYATIPWRHGRTYVTALTSMAQQIINAADILNKVSGVTEMAYGDALSIQPRWTVEDQDWIELPINGSIDTGSEPSFAEMDPISNIRLHWLFDESKMDRWKWIFRDMMYTIVDKAALDRSVIRQAGETPLPIWPSNRMIPAGDLITQPYTDTLIPFNYTVGRRRAWNEYNMLSWRNRMSSPERPFSIKELFENAVTTIATLPHEQANSVADALAGNFAIVIQNGEYEDMSDLFNNVDRPAVAWKDLKLLKPTLPAIWGAPTVTYLKYDAPIIGYSDRKFTTGSYTSEDDLKQSVKEGFAFVADYYNTYGAKPMRAYFCLRSIYPKPGSASPVMWTPRKGIFMGVMLADYAIDALTDSKPAEIRKRLESASDMTTIPWSAWNSSSIVDKLPRSAFEEPMGWSDLITPWAHINMDASPQVINSLETTWAPFVGNKVMMYQDPITRDFRMRASAVITPYLIDYTDYDRIRDISDPILVASSDVVAAEDISDAKPNDDKIGGIKTASVKAETPAPSAALSEEQNVSSIIATPILATSGGTPVITVPTGMGESEPLLGGNPSARGLDSEPAPAKTKIWKKVKEGKIVDVVMAPDCPPDYVPGSQEDWDNFKAESSTETSKE